MPLLDAFFMMMWFFLWILWFFLLFRVILDIFRSRDLGGWGKAGWLAFVIILPFLGVFVYLIARGHKMAERDAAQAQAQDEAFRSYVQETAAGTAPPTSSLSWLTCATTGQSARPNSSRARTRSSRQRPDLCPGWQGWSWLTPSG